MIVLQTERLELRWFDAQDADFVLELLTDPSWIRHIGDRGLRCADDARKWIETRFVDTYWRQGFGFWAVQRRHDRVLLGLCGLNKRDTLPEVDVGYAFLPRHWGQGYAREAARACLQYSREVLGLPRILAITSPDNTPSQRLLENIGMQQEGRRMLPGDERETLVYASAALPGVDHSALPSDEAQIEALAHRFLNLFDNRGNAIPRLPMLPSLCLPGARVVKATGTMPESTDIRGFMEARVPLFDEGGLVDFAECEVQGKTQVFGRIAQRWLSYAKAGFLDGVVYRGMGWKSLHFVRTPVGWRISEVIWDDEPEPD